jgi:hypothetical protein
MSNLEQARTEASEHRTEFLRHFREACISLGKYCAAMQKVQEMTNASARANAAGVVLPQDQSAMRALRIYDPIHQLREDGYEPDTDYGWNLKFVCAPMRKRN